jgi:hypothetical protein
MGIPFTGGTRNSDGHYPGDGAGLSVNPIYNALPFPSAAEPTKYTVAVSRNWFDGNSSAVILQRGLQQTLGLALLDNRIGPHLYEFSPGVNPSTYPIRIYVTTGGVNRFGTNGTPLVEGRNSGIVYS